MSEATRAPILASLGGGVVGAVLTAAVLLVAAPEFLSDRIVRQGLMNDPQILVETADALRDPRR